MENNSDFTQEINEIKDDNVDHNFYNDNFCN